MVPSLFLIGCLAMATLSLQEVSSKLTPLDWWQTSIFYQIYPRSFKDVNGDGIGDLKGIIRKLNYLKDLGVGAIWLSPIYKSPMVDFGYDISDFRDIEPVFGTITDFNNLRAETTAKNIKLVLDFVPNHSSNEHIWFQKSVDKISPYTDYYVWRDAKIINGARHPPTNWLSDFGGSAWEWNEKRQQYYFHAFAIQQPDLNYRNPLVVEEMKNVLRYWIERGVDGFRMDAIPYLFESIDLRDEPLANDYQEHEPTDHTYLNHTLTLDQPETYDLVFQFRALLDSYKLLDGYTRVMMTECYSPLEKLVQYYGNTTRRGANFAFNFLPIVRLSRQSNARDFANVIREWESAKPKEAWGNWVIGNHDNKRPASRFDAEFIDGLHMLNLLLPGTAITYNGDELGMEDSFIRWDQTVDPQAINVGPKRYQQFSRDFPRSPFQWDSSPNAGFTTNLYSWLPVNPNYWFKNLAVERKDKRSHLNVYKALAKLRQTATIQRGDLDVYDLSEWVLCFVRSYGDHPTYIVVMNIGSEIEYADILSIRPTMPEQLNVYTASANSGHPPGTTVNTDKILLKPKEALTLSTVELSLVHDHIKLNGNLDLDWNLARRNASNIAGFPLEVLDDEEEWEETED
uniref:alpha-glucosidase n=1 Tax=Cacopsylla melanoneura TaxID=428564 RepID=A0A8D9FIB2_9HEMI